jgi:alkyl sulfatase BDS1-like metallo-beta-lactamase superfamily hydrolase
MSTKNKIIIAIALIAAIAFGVYYYVFVYSSQHRRQVQSEIGIAITSDSLVAKYQADEKLANSLYLNKAVVVTGNLLSIDKNQEGKTTLVIGRTDSFSNVSVTMISTAAIIQKVGESITIKGLCTGALSDVVITDGVVE